MKHKVKFVINILNNLFFKTNCLKSYFFIKCWITNIWILSSGYAPFSIQHKLGWQETQRQLPCKGVKLAWGGSVIKEATPSSFLTTWLQTQFEIGCRSGGHSVITKVEHFENFCQMKLIQKFDLQERFLYDFFPSVNSFKIFLDLRVKVHLVNIQEEKI